MSLIVEAQAGEATEAFVQRAFSESRAAMAEAVALRFPEGAFDRTATDVIAAAAAGHDHVKHLVLVHPSPLLGFVASSLNLRVTQARVQSASDLDSAKEMLAAVA